MRDIVSTVVKRNLNVYMSQGPRTGPNKVTDRGRKGMRSKTKVPCLLSVSTISTAKNLFPLSIRRHILLLPTLIKGPRPAMPIMFDTHVGPRTELKLIDYEL